MHGAKYRSPAVGLKPSLGALSTNGVVPACRSLDCVSIFARSAAEASAVFAVAAADAADPYSRVVTQHPLAGFRAAIPSRATRRFLGDTAAEQAFDATLERLAGQGATLTEIDFTPFFETAALLYEGPWVAERYVAVKALIESNPDALHPVTRAIIGGARRHSAADAFAAFYRLADYKRAIAPLWDAADMLISHDRYAGDRRRRRASHGPAAERTAHRARRDLRARSTHQ